MAKIESRREAEKFNPVILEVKLESEAEVKAFYALFDHKAVTSYLNPHFGVNFPYAMKSAIHEAMGNFTTDVAVFKKVIDGWIKEYLDSKKD